MIFCACNKEGGEFDKAPPLGGFSVYVEDGDLDENSEPKDEIFAALLLDAEQNQNSSNESYVNYLRYLDPSLPVGLAFGTNYDARLQDYGRARPGLREVSIRDADTVNRPFIDLCNGNQVGPSLTKGFHTLTVLVTDRPWFKAPMLIDTNDDDKPDTPLKLPNGQIAMSAQQGVPDLPSGATYDTNTYTFYCYNKQDPECSNRCITSDDVDF